MNNQEILIGWSKRDVTPEKKVSLLGQFHLRISDKANDPLYTTALALESHNSNDQAILVSLDTVLISEEVLAGCRAALSKGLPNFNPQNLIINATHTHTAPGQPGFILEQVPLPNDVMTDEEYGNLLIEKISEAACEAWNKRKPGAIAWGKGYAVVGFNRRMSYFNGTSAMYGNTNSPDFSHVEGHEDHSLDLLFTYDSDRELTGMIVNVPCPSQCTESANYISADFWYETRIKIHERYGNDLFILPQCSAAGDLSPRTMINLDADARMMELKGYGSHYDTARRRDIADKITAAIDDVLPPVSNDIRNKVTFTHKVLNLEVPTREVKDEDIEEATKAILFWQEKLDNLQDMEPTSREYSMAFTRVHFYKRIIDICEKQKQEGAKNMPIEVHVIRIGDIAICTNRFEYYLDFSDRIKARSKAIQTFIVQLAGNGSYLPTSRSVSHGSYGTDITNAPVKPEGGQIIAEETLKVIDELFKEK